MLFSKKEKYSDIKNIPNHVAIIMDGNYRWAKSKNLSLAFGHKKGVENIENIVDISLDLGIEYLTLYAFSSENWTRPKEEVDYLIKLLNDYLENDVEILIKKNIKIVISGDLTLLSKKTKQSIVNIENRPKQNKILTLNIAFSYGGRQEITNALKKIIADVCDNKINIEDINESVIAKNLYQPSIPDPDLLIRTAGDFRISNFLLWQIAYTELYFSKIFWPEFSKKEFLEAIINFNKRERKYGKR